MPKCPNCNSEIDNLEAITEEQSHFIIRLPKNEDEKKEFEYDIETGVLWIKDIIETPVKNSYVCPRCKARLTMDTDEAVKFLKEKLGRLVCDRCGATYTDWDSITMARKFKDDWARLCQRDGDEPRGWASCPNIACPGELIYKEE